MKKRILVIGLAFFALSFLLPSGAEAGWYVCFVDNITPTASGSCAIRFSPGTGETRFTGAVRGYIDSSQPGAKQMLAVILTAVSMGCEVSVEMANTPTFTPSQEITAIAFLTP